MVHRTETVTLLSHCHTPPGLPYKLHHLPIVTESFLALFTVPNLRTWSACSSYTVTLYVSTTVRMRDGCVGGSTHTSQCLVQVTQRLRHVVIPTALCVCPTAVPTPVWPWVSPLRAPLHRPAPPKQAAAAPARSIPSLPCPRLRHQQLPFSYLASQYEPSQYKPCWRMPPLTAPASPIHRFPSCTSPSKPQDSRTLTCTSQYAPQRQMPSPWRSTRSPSTWR